MDFQSLERSLRLLPWRYLGWSIAIIFAVEIAIMGALSTWLGEHLTAVEATLLDGTILVLCSAPLLWRLALMPVRDMALRASGEYRRVLESAADAIVVIDDRGTIETFNRSAERVFGYSAREVLGRNVNMLMPSPDREGHDEYLGRYLRTGERRIIGTVRPVMGQRKDGTNFSAELHVSEVRSPGRLRFTAIVQDVTERLALQGRLAAASAELAEKNTNLEQVARQLADLNAELALTARTDALTGLLSRRAWLESAQLDHERLDRHGRGYGVILIDVDHFKAYNDALGHPAGDACLERTAKAMAGSVRATDLLGRFGGEEFVVLASESGWEDARELADRIRLAVEREAIAHPGSRTASCVTISAGVAVRRAGCELSDVIREADEALYIAKRQGRNRVEVHAASVGTLQSSS